MSENSAHANDPQWLKQRLLEPAFRNAFNSLVITDADFTNGGPHIVAVNPAFCAMTGYSEDELIGRSPRILQGPETNPAVIDRLSTAIRTGEYFHGRTVNYRKDGTPYDVEWNISAVVEDGVIVGYVSVQQDLTARIASERDHALFTTVGNLLPVPLVVTDNEHRITYLNDEFARVTGYSPEELVGQSPEILYDPAIRAESFAADTQALAADSEVQRRLVLRHKDGSAIHTAQRVIPLRFDDGRARIHVGTFTDVSEYAQSEARWRSLANLDALTGIPNRRAADAALAAMIRTATRHHDRLAVMMCDIDHFKRINDKFGHPAGDRVLAMVARALDDGLRDGDVVARFGGEEFLVAAPGIGTTAAAALAERLRTRVAEASDAEVGGVTVSLGMALWDEGESMAELIERADLALYQAKEQGRNRVVCADPL